MEIKESTLGIFIDISKVFKTINHEILLAKFYHCGIRGTAHKWFKSYLSNRKQSTLYENQLFKSVCINYGVLQGSSLGPILFLIYINDFHHCLLNADAIMYADGTNIFLHHKHPNNLLENTQIEIENMTN